MDVASGVIGIIGVTDQILVQMYKVYSNWKGAPDDIRNFALELQSLRSALSQVVQHMSNPQFVQAFQRKHSALLSEFDPFHETDNETLLAACESELAKLLEQLKKRSEGHRYGLERLKAAAQQTKLREAVENLQRRCLSFTLLFHTDVAALTANTYNEVKSIRQQIDNTEARRKREEILKWLTPVNYAVHHADILNRRQPGTGQWLLKAPAFRRWVSIAMNSLFCPGIPGAGKTFLAATVIDHLQQEFDRRKGVGIVFLYCNFRRREEQKADDLVANILKQLAEYHEPIPRAVLDLHQRHSRRSTRPSLDELIQACTAVATLFTDRVFLVIDALDECQFSNNNRSLFLEALLKIQCSKGSSVNLLATSRPGIFDIAATFQGCPTVEILANPDDIARYARSQLERPGNFIAKHADLHGQIIDSIVKAADGMFLLAHLFLQSLVERVTRRQIKNHLDTLIRQESSSSPDDRRLSLLSLAYDGAMERINGQIDEHKSLAHHVLTWIICAFRPLVAYEIQHAWAVRDSKDELDQDSVPDVADMISVCCGLVTADNESGVIRLVHYTTQEYFERTLGKWFGDPHAEIARTCISYLSLRPFSSGHCAWPEDLERRVMENPLFCYASRYWGSHVEVASSPVDNEELFSFLSNLSLVQAAFQGFQTFRSEGAIESLRQFMSNEENGNVLHLLACLGLDSVLCRLLDHSEFPDLNQKTSWGRTPLFHASKEGHIGVVQLLIAQSEVDVNAICSGRVVSKRDTALSAAIDHGHKNVVEALLTSKDIDLSISLDRVFFRLPRNIDTLRTCMETLEPLFRTGHINATLGLFGSRRCTILMAAAACCSPGIVAELLALDHIDVNVQDKHGWTALHHVTSSPSKPAHLETVKLLLAVPGIDVNAQDEYGQTALHRAVIESHSMFPAGLETIRLLLAEPSIDVNAQDEYGRTALHLAVVAWHSPYPACIETVKLLLAAPGIDANARESQEGCTPLMLACDQEDQDVVRALLTSRNINLEAKNDKGQTVLLRAAGKGHEKMVRFLASLTGIDLNPRDSEGRTALMCAAWAGHEEVVQFLVSLPGVDINATDNRGATSLIYAASRGREAIVCLLAFLPGLNINASDCDGFTALIRAVCQTCEDVARFLISVKALDINASTKDGLTALHVAASVRSESIFHLLLLADGIDINVKDRRRGTPLIWAATLGWEQCVRVLLDWRDADINAKDKWGCTALWYAAKCDWKEIVHALLYAKGWQVQAEVDLQQLMISECGFVDHPVAESVWKGEGWYEDWEEVGA